jgi:arylsulfatase A-like enzyme
VIQRPWSSAWSCIVVCALIAAGCFAREKRRPGTPPHNLLLVTTSALRKDHLSAFMYARPTSAWPATEEERRQGRALAVDDLAEQGVMFADASSGSARAFPALCELFTGTRGASSSDPADDRALEPEAATLSKRFKAAGFKTAAFVAGTTFAAGTPQHEARDAKEAHGIDQGFDLWCTRFSDMAVLDQARQWLQDAEQEPGKTWFVWVHLAGCEPPHDPRGLPTLPGDMPGVLDFGRLYTDANYSGTADGSLAYLKSLQSGERTADEKDRARIVDLYDGEVARVATSVRSLALSLRNLDEQGRRWNDTLFVFAGMHGIELGDTSPRAFGNDSLCASVVGIPLFFRHPLSLTGSRVMAEPVGLEDIAPTICEWFGFPALAAREHSIRGRSLLPLVDTYIHREFEHRPAFTSQSGPRPSLALRTREAAIIETAREGESSFALFDRIADPAERHDIAASRKELLASMRAALEHTSFEAVRTP